MTYTYLRERNEKPSRGITMKEAMVKEQDTIMMMEMGEGKVQLNDAITYVPPRKKLPKPLDESSRVRKEQEKREKGVLEKMKADKRKGYITDALLDKSNLFMLSRHAALNASISEDIITSIEEPTTTTSIKEFQPDNANNTYLLPKPHDEDTDQRATKNIDDSKRAEEKKGCITDELVIKP
ncbi:16644_t:CDS:1, partial [Acaulospora morrowiae]